MKFNRAFSLTALSLIAAANLGAAGGQQPQTSARAEATKSALSTRDAGLAQTPKPTPAQILKPAGQTPKPTPTPTGKSEAKTPAAASGAKSDPSAAQLIEQGKTLYRAQRFKPALAKFEAV